MGVTEGAWCGECQTSGRPAEARPGENGEVLGVVIGSGPRRKSKQNRGMLVRLEVADKQVGGLEGVPRPEVELSVQLGGGRRVKSSQGKWDAPDTD